MALELKIKACINDGCKKLNFYETTGEESVSNTTGWGLAVGPTNPQLTDVSGTPTLTITSTAFDGSVVIDLASFPTKDDTAIKEILPTDIDSSWDKIKDGYYIFTYQVYVVVSGVLTLYTGVHHKIFYCNAKCCMDSLAKDIGKVSCECAGKLPATEDKFLTGFALYKGLMSSARRLDIASFSKIIKTLNKLCQQSDCGCGCN